MWAMMLAVGVILGSVGPAWAWSANYIWAPSANATSYKVEKSTDQGVTWVAVQTVTTPALTYTGTEPGLLLIRVSACNANGCTIRSGDGLWHNESWAPPPAPTGLGVQ